MSKALTKTGLKELIQGPEGKRFFQEVAAIVPKGYGDASKLGKQLLIAASNNPRILNCSSVSLWAAMTHAAELGVNISGLQGEAYIVPYKTTAQFQIGYRGLLRLLRRSGNVKSVEANIVYENEHFINRAGSNPVFEHEPMPPSKRGDMIAVYALVYYKDVGMEKAVLWKEQVDKIRDHSPTGRSPDSPWKKWYEEMAKKTAIRALMKYAPIQTDDYEALAKAEQAEYSVIGEDPPEPSSGAASLNKNLGMEVEDADFEDAPSAPPAAPPPAPPPSAPPPPPEAPPAEKEEPKKRRGRPRKNPLPEEEVDITTGEVLDTPEPAAPAQEVAPDEGGSLFE